MCTYNHVRFAMKLLLLLIPVLLIISATGEVLELRPAEMAEFTAVESGLRRRLGSYQLCLLCKCCASGATCLTMPCCFGIDCQLPNKPYGVCAFVPKSCNCTSCAS